jgi:hypothetical protein
MPAHLTRFDTERHGDSFDEVETCGDHAARDIGGFYGFAQSAGDFDPRRPPGDQGACSGLPPDVGPAAPREARPVPRYLLQHRHEPQECGVVFASFKGHPSPLRHRPTLASCRSGGHAIWWTVEAESEEDALRLLPDYVAARTTASRVSEIEIP